ncbi:hypothetical protein Hanom_Chr07g00632571 [Helianthus anomalus]
MVITISSFTPELLAVLDSITTQRHLRFWPNFLTASHILYQTFHVLYVLFFLTECKNHLQAHRALYYCS